MRNVKTHKFKLGKYHIHIGKGIDGLCDVPDNVPWSKQKHNIIILEGKSFNAFHTALHEGLHAEGIPDEYLHDKEGYPTTHRLAMFLWRLGYRKQLKK